MTGMRKGVFSFLQKLQPSLHLAGCPCHLVHHAAEKGASCLPFSIDEILVDTFYYFKHSSKWLAALEEKQLLFDVTDINILKHVLTRWLSIGRSLQRVLENWDALKAYFKEERKEATTQQQKSNRNPQSRLQRLEEFFASPSKWLYCIFLQFAIKPFDEFNTIMQSEAPMIHLLRLNLHKLLNSLFNRFLKPSCRLGKNLLEVKFEDTNNYRKDDEIIIGDEARRFIGNAKDNYLKSSKVQEFYGELKMFYVESCRYLRAEVAYPQLGQSSSFSDIRCFLE